jgi:hypothetical protein
MRKLRSMFIYIFEKMDINYLIFELKKAQLIDFQLVALLHSRNNGIRTCDLVDVNDAL